MNLSDYIERIRTCSSEDLKWTLKGMFEPLFIGKAYPDVTDYMFSKGYEISDNFHGWGSQFWRLSGVFLQPKNKIIDIITQPRSSDEEIDESSCLIYGFKSDSNFRFKDITSIEFRNRSNLFGKEGYTHVDDFVFNEIKKVMLHFGEFAVAEKFPLWLIDSDRINYYSSEGEKQ